MKISELECPSCGGKLKVDEKNPSIAICEYCNSQFALEWDNDQAYFNRGINYTIPKAPESARDGGFGLNGKKGVVLAGCVMALLLMIFCISQLGGGRGQGREQTDSSGLTIDLSDFPEAGGGSKAEADGEEEELKAPVGALGEMVSYIFEKPAEAVSKEELGKIKWLEEEGDIDNLWLGWSFDDPEMEGAELTWVSLPRDMELGKESLYLFTGLKKISLNQLIDREDIKGLKLESIGGYFGSPAEVSAILEDTGLIRELRFNAGADTLEGLGDFTGLESLYVDYCELDDLKPIVQIPELKKLTFEGLPEIDDFSVLGTMVNLEELSLQAENLKVLDFLKGLKKLKRLKLMDGSMISLDGVEALPQLTALAIEDCGELRSMEALIGLENLKELSLELAYECEEPDLSRLTELEKLSLIYFDDCSFVGKLTELEELSLEGCTISPGVDLSGLTKLKSLTCHYFVSTGQDLSFASGFPALEKLDLQGMATYDDISWAFNSATLRELNISGMECEINFDLIGENHVMEKLSMDGMVLYENVQVSGGGGIVYVDWDDVELKEHMAFLGKLKGLKSLSVAENELTDIEFAAELPALEVLDFSDNYVTDLKPLTGLKALKSVNCSGNPVSNDRVLDERVLLINE